VDSITKDAMGMLSRVVGPAAVGLSLNELIIGYKLKDILDPGEHILVQTRMDKVLNLLVVGMGEVYTDFWLDENGTMHSQHVVICESPGA
jgi:hypothetical protein